MASNFEFTLTFAIQHSADSMDLEKRLFEAGCDDAIIGLGQKGRLALNFDREAESAEIAILSALRDVKQALPNANLIEAGPDLVGVSDMARLLEFSRQNMRKLIKTHLMSFPLPLHEGTSAIWHLVDVLEWFEAKQKRNLPSALLDVARVSMGVNLARETKRMNYRLQSQLENIT